jgi:hypothetical protein
MTQSAPLSRDALLGRTARTYETVAVRALDGALIRVQSLTGAERGKFEKALRAPGKKGEEGEIVTEHFRTKLIALAIVDDTGAPQFTLEDVAAINQLPAAAISEIFDVAARLSGIGATAAKDAVGNSDETPSDETSAP